MTKLWAHLYNLLHDDRGQGMVEYGLILALVAVAAIFALGALGDGLNGLFTDITTDINSR